MSTPVASIKWTGEQWWVLITLGVCHLCNGMTVSLLAPFYPAEAEEKGASPTQYGFVFGIFQLTAFIVSPVIGRFLPRLGHRLTFSGGLGFTGLLNIMFGLLNLVDGVETFIALSFLVRILTAFGYSSFLASSFTLIAQLFPHSVATVFALVEMSFGVGMIVGPTVGGALYQCGGYTLPFGVLGGLLIIQALLSLLTLPHSSTHINETERSSSHGICNALAIPSVAIVTFAVFSGSIAVGALQTTLERHLSQFDLTPMQVGLFFMIYGIAYAVPNPLWGWVADKYSPKLVIIVGSFLLVLGHLLIGPLPGLGLRPSYRLCIVAVIVAGVGLGAQLVATFSEAQKAAVARGFPDDISTYSTISSIWTSSFALGAFVGPTTAGALYEVIGFSWAMVFTGGWSLLVLLLMTGNLILSGCKLGVDKEEASHKKQEEKDYGAIKRRRSRKSRSSRLSEREPLLTPMGGFQP